MPTAAAVSVAYYLPSLNTCHGSHRDLHSFPTRRSSDLVDASVVRNGVDPGRFGAGAPGERERFRSEEHTSDSSHRTISYAVFCLKKKKQFRYERTRGRARSLTLSCWHRGQPVSSSRPRT